MKSEKNNFDHLSAEKYQYYREDSTQAKTEFCKMIT